MAYPDRILGATLSGGSWSSSLPLNNLKDPIVTKKARSTNALAASTQFDADLGSLQPLRFMAIIKHNASAVATVRFRFYTGANHTGLVLDTGVSGLPFYPSFFPHGILEWEDDSFWNGELTKDDIAAGYKPDFWYDLGQTISARYVWVTITDTGNADMYFELGRCFIAPAWQPQVNLSYGVQVGYETDTQIQRALGGTAFFDVREGRRVIAGNFEGLSEAEGMIMGFYTHRRLGIHGELYFVYNPSDTLLLYKQRGFLCRHKSINPIEFPYLDNTRLAFAFEEIV